MWTKSTDERLLLWREQREQISTMSKEEAINEVARYWSKAPISSQYLSADLIRDWPDPWVLLHDNHYDDISITLMMVYTLVFGRDDCDDIEYKIFRSDSEELHTAWFDDGRYIMNYEYSDVVDKNKLSPDLNLIYTYNYTDLKINNFK